MPVSLPESFHFREMNSVDVSAVLQKMNVYNRTQAVILANKVGFKT